MAHSLESSLLDYLNEQARRFQKLTRKVRRNPEPEIIHKLRVCTRRIRAVIWILKREPGGNQWRGAGRRFKRLGRALGERRELDVIASSAEYFQLDANPLKKRARRAGEKILAQTRRRRRLKLRKDLKRMQRALRGGDRLILATMLAPLRSELAHWHGRAISRENYHEFRIAVKKVRYLLEALGADGEPLKPLQDNLGHAHDLAVLQEELGPSDAANRELEESFRKGKRGQLPALRYSEQSLTRLHETYLPN